MISAYVKSRSSVTGGWQNWFIDMPAVPRPGDEFEINNISYVVEKIVWVARTIPGAIDTVRLVIELKEPEDA